MTIKKVIICTFLLMYPTNIHAAEIPVQPTLARLKNFFSTTKEFVPSRRTIQTTLDALSDVAFCAIAPTNAFVSTTADRICRRDNLCDFVAHTVLAMTDPIGTAAQNLADSILYSRKAWGNLSNSQKKNAICTIAGRAYSLVKIGQAYSLAKTAQTHTFDDRVKLSTDTPVTHIWDIERSANEICESQKFEWGDDIVCSRTDLYTKTKNILPRPVICTHVFQCNSLKNPTPNDTIILLPGIPNIRINAQSTEGSFPLKMVENCESIENQLPPKYVVSYHTPGYRVNSTIRWRNTPWWATCMIESHSGQDSYLAALPSVVYQNGTSVYSITETHTVKQCRFPQQTDCRVCTSETPFLVVELGGQKAIYPYQDRATSKEDGRVLFQKIENCS